MKSYSPKSNAEKFWGDVSETMVDNLVLVLHVLKEQYGFGDKRLRDFLDGVYAKARKFDEMIDDGVFEIKTEEDRKKYKDVLHNLIRVRSKSYMPADIYSLLYEDKMPTNQQARREAKQKRKAKAAVSIKQAEALRNNMLECKGWWSNNVKL
jgi:hypothetical protein|nr:MAG TPA: hypothetical protein [Caudoviricetes sp.]